MKTFLSLTLTLFAFSTFASEDEIDQSFIRSLVGVYVASDGYCDQHLEIVSVNRKRAIITLSNVISQDKMDRLGLNCGHHQGCNGDSMTISCDSSNLCYYLNDEAKILPAAVLHEDNNIATRYPRGLTKLWQSSSAKWYTCQ